MSLSAKPKIIVILGPTASGKTSLAVKLAAELNGEIVSADSRQVYRGMDIGTGKDLDEYQTTPCHLIDVAEPNEQYDLAKYKKDAEAAIDDILKQGKLPFLVGGSGLYLQAVVDGYGLTGVEPDNGLRQDLEGKSAVELMALLKTQNPIFAERLNNSDANNPRRLIRYLEVAKSNDGPREHCPRYDCLLIGLMPDEETMKKKIKSRLLERLNNENLVGEVERLNNEGVTWQRLEKFGLEYRWVARYLQGKLEYDEMTEKLNTDIFKFSKRQLSWFKRWEKQGQKINWIDGLEAARKVIDSFIN